MCQRDHFDVTNVFAVYDEVRKMSEWYPAGGPADSDAMDNTPDGRVLRNEAECMLQFIPELLTEPDSLGFVP